MFLLSLQSETGQINSFVTSEQLELDGIQVNLNQLISSRPKNLTEVIPE